MNMQSFIDYPEQTLSQKEIMIREFDQTTVLQTFGKSTVFFHENVCINIDGSESMYEKWFLEYEIIDTSKAYSDLEWNLSRAIYCNYNNAVSIDHMLEVQDNEQKDLLFSIALDFLGLYHCPEDEIIYFYSKKTYEMETFQNKYSRL